MAALLQRARKLLNLIGRVEDERARMAFLSLVGVLRRGGSVSHGRLMRSP
jgi:hypothetical protein